MVSPVAGDSGRTPAFAPSDDFVSSVMAALDISPEGLLLLRAVRDAAGRLEQLQFTYANRSALRLIRRTREEILGRDMREVFPNAEGEGHWARYSAVVETGDPFVSEWYYGHDDMPGWYRVQAVRISDGLAIGFHDISERVAAVHQLEQRDEQLREALAAAEAAGRARSEFVATMSHELRSPLNAIGGHVQLVLMGLHGRVTDAQRESLERVERAQRHLLGLINDVLNVARVDAGQVHYDIAAVMLATVVDEVRQLVAPQFEARRIALQVDVPPALAALADGDKLRQVLLNLLSNALKFTAEGGHVSLVAVPDDGRVLVRVADTGIGIPPNRLGDIFERFVQVHGSFRPPEGGTGLGLAISRDLARGMGGDLTVESEAGAGSTFTLALRLPPDADARS